MPQHHVLSWREPGEPCIESQAGNLLTAPLELEGTQVPQVPAPYLCPLPLACSSRLPTSPPLRGSVVPAALWLPGSHPDPPGALG